MLASGWSMGAQAQSLVELYDSARSYDATYMAAKLQFEAVQSAYEQRKSLRMPSLNLQAGLTRNANDSEQRSESNTTTTGTPAPSVKSSASESNASTSSQQTDQRLTLSAQQTLFNRSNDLTIEQAERSLSQARTSVQAAEQDLMVRVSQAYFDLMAVQDSLKLLAAQKEAVQEQLASAKRRFEVGTATIIDTREAQASYDLILAQEIAILGDLAIKKSALEQLVGKQDVTTHVLANPARLPELKQDENHWIATGQANPQLQTRRLDLEVARLETQKAKAGHLPTLTLSASVARSVPTGSSTSTSSSSANNITSSNTTTETQSRTRQTSWPGNSTQASVGLVMNLPLFSGFAVQNRIRETTSLEAKAEKDLEGLQRTVAQTIRTVYFKLRADLGQVKALEAAELSRQSALESNRLGYQVGVGTNIDVLNSQSQLFQTRRDLSRARYDVLVGDLRLKQAAGVLTSADLQPINALLAPR